MAAVPGIVVQCGFRMRVPAKNAPLSRSFGLLYEQPKPLDSLSQEIVGFGNIDDRKPDVVRQSERCSSLGKDLGVARNDGDRVLNIVARLPDLLAQFPKRRARI